MKPQDFMGKIIEFEDSFEQDSFDPGMRARVVSVSEPHNSVIDVLCDFSDFEEHNKLKAVACWWDKNGQATLMWHETTFYPKDCRCKVYLDQDFEKYPPFFHILDEVSVEQMELDRVTKRLKKATTLLKEAKFQLDVLYAPDCPTAKETAKSIGEFLETKSTGTE